MKVKSYSIKDVCDVFDGPHATPSPSSEGPIYLGITSIREDGSIDYKNSKRIAWDEYPKWTKRVTPKAGDVVFSYEANLGTYAIIPEGFVGCLGRRMAVMRPHPDKVLSKFLYYCMLSPRWKEVIASKTVLGATVNRIPIANYPDFPIELPDMRTQAKIVAVLSAFDELIENNRRQIKLLEEAAQRLYKEWFVDLKFPSHETTHIHSGLPEGWERVSLRNFIASHIGGGWGKELSESSYSVQAAVIRATDIEAIRNGSVKYIPVRWHSESNFQKRKLGVGDIVFEVSGGSKEAGVGRSLLITEEVLSMFDGPAICASFCKRIHLAEFADSALLYWKIRSDLKAGLIRKYEKSSAGNIINFHWEDFLDGYELLIPCSPVKEKFVSAVGAYAKALGICIKQISAAREARDRLLPKLMSGEIEV